jgi:arylsulfatase A-like enzyme
VGTIARALEESGRAERTVVIVTADHGEGLGEHDGYFGHDIQLYETSMRVPLLVSGGGVPHESAPQREPARTMDIAPTILGLMAPGVPHPAMEGRDLLRDPPPTGDALLFVGETHPTREKASPLYAMRTGTEKVIWDPRHGRREYYDLASDPEERFDLAGNVTDLLRVLGEDLELDLRHRPVGHTQTIDDLAGGADAKTREALESLGYLN